MKTFSRIFTVLFPKKARRLVNKRHLALYVRDFLFLVLLLLIGVQLQLLVFLHNRIEMETSVYEQRIREYTYWRSISEQFPNVPDILYNASLASIRADKKEEAKMYIDKAVLLDPLFRKAKSLQELLNG